MHQCAVNLACTVRLGPLRDRSVAANEARRPQGHGSLGVTHGSGYVIQRIFLIYVLIFILATYRIWCISNNMSALARTPRQIGNIVRRSRKALGLNQTQLGEKAGLRQETISLIETGNPAAKMKTILAVLAALDLEFRIGSRTKGNAKDIEGIF